MLGDARGTGAGGVMSFPLPITPCYHTSRSRAARVAQHEDDWEKKMKTTGDESDAHEYFGETWRPIAYQEPAILWTESRANLELKVKSVKSRG